MEGHFRVLFQDQIHDPYFNLAMEEYFLQKLLNDKAGAQMFLLYSNKDAVVCGKNQSIWAEANLQFCRENGIKPAKRLSGGGTVYHDPGNLNLCYITDRKTEWVSNFSVFNAPVISFLRNLGVQAEENERQDILIQGKKISGNAQHLSKNLLLSHATLLFGANLKKVSTALKNPFVAVESRGIDSKRVPVTNISEYLREDLGVAEFSRRLFEHISGQFAESEVVTLSPEDLHAIQKLADEKFSRDAWIYGQSPDTRIKMNLGKHVLEVLVQKGNCREVKYHGSEAEQKILDRFLSGQMFTLSNLEKNLSSLNSAREKHLIQLFLEESGL